ncbi:Bordetella pertussis toxin A [Akanthomyces lecanii RCEF 1005]|uniref:Bordetella pertussis toxin A n=1 Tax=Akanthomyces lecanii RCEF 1005 TaxID=1081108 RepID=A0A162KMV0_CORDF|nr:Bordetella pertussis toxin A [Akanthomyces lecanii RCEF 1005]
MKGLQIVALYAIRALATPQPLNVPELDESNVLSVDGVEVEGNIIIKPIFDILSWRNGRVGALSFSDGARDIFRRDKPDTPVTISAVEASKAKIPGLGEHGLFYRGDPRPYSEIFQKGFTPQGKDMNLQHHLSFTGNSGFVSVSRSPSAAEMYAFGRTDAKVEKGYIYVIAPEGMPDGYWVPGIFPPQKNPAVRRNLEFAAAGPVAAQSIVLAYEVSRDNPGAKGKKIVNEYYRAKSLPPCLGRKRTLCDPAKAVAGAKPDEAKGRKGQGGSRDGPDRSKPKSQSKSRFRSGAKIGSALAFQVLSPYAHDVLDMVKKWDNPIGRGVTWFDDSMASLQKSIGGEQVPEIHGNVLKLRIICWLRGEQRHPNSVDRACQRLRESENPPKHDDADLRLEGLNQVLRACEVIEKTASTSDAVQFEMLQRCYVFRDKAAELEVFATEAARGGEGVNYGVTNNGESVPASVIAKDDEANEEAMEVMGLYGELFQNDLALSGTELCWSTAGLQSSRPSGWDLVSSALVYYDENGKAEASCRACQKEDRWALRCGSIAR